eukprot:COSAG05_NODE_3811_length_1826_cov_12.856623_1_plen_47_part_10
MALSCRYSHAKQGVSDGVFVCEEEDVHTLAGLNLQVELGDFDPLDTP